jgi:hypothetical protein
MSFSFRRPLVVLLLHLLLVAWCVGPAAAVEADQNLKLSYGWNAVWLEVEPQDASGGHLTCDQVFRSDGFRIDRVASQVGGIGTAEFTSDPESLFNQGGWDVWASDPASGESANIAIRGNHSYLVHVAPNTGMAVQNGDPAGVLNLRGEVVFYQPTWEKGSFNLVGFGIQGAPTFASLMAGSTIVVDEPVGASPNVQRLDSATGAWQAVKGTDTAENGMAYWINVPYTLPGQGWAGPVAIDFPGAITGSMNFGSGPGSLRVFNPADPGTAPTFMSSAELTFSNLVRSGDTQPQVSLTRLAPANSDPAAGDLQFFALQPVPEELTWQRLPVDFNAGWAAASLGAGASKSVTVGVQRHWTTGVYLREHLYKVSVSLSGGSVYRYLPVTATNEDLPADSSSTPAASSFTGLWAGRIILNQVTSLGTAGAPVQPTSSQLPLSIYIHVDANGQARLVPRSILMQTKTASSDLAPTPVLVVNETRIPFFEGIQQRADGVRVGIRLETANFDLPRDLSAASLSSSLRSSVATARNVAPAEVTDSDVSAYFSLGTRSSRPSDLPEQYLSALPLDGQLGVGKTIRTPEASPLSLDPFHRSNPFRHAFHPQHAVGYAVTRRFSIRFEAAPGSTILTGTYPETTGGLARQDIVSKGSITLQRVSSAATLE